MPSPDVGKTTGQGQPAPRNSDETTADPVPDIDLNDPLQRFRLKGVAGTRSTLVRASIDDLKSGDKYFVGVDDLIEEEYRVTEIDPDKQTVKLKGHDMKEYVLKRFKSASR